MMGSNQRDQILSGILRAFCSLIISMVGFGRHIYPFCSGLRRKCPIGKSTQYLENILFSYSNLLNICLIWISTVTSS
ncbi:hypothetical protein C8J57DRAFT_1349628 [Mycena rebaudengoi]|nr:hypothetical protein C8J57DRAFT_1349628 [Mycena rebaudengoi]